MSEPRPSPGPEDLDTPPELEEHLASLLSPDSFETDQYRVLRHFLHKVRAEKGQSVLAVTSPAAGDGKTTTAINLAATLAQSSGTRVLLADTDLRRPFVARNLGLRDHGPGLAGAILDARLELGAIVRRTPFRLDVLPAGPSPDNTYQVMESSRLAQILEEARAAYDYVVLDTPPLLVVPECRLVAQWVDGFLVVIAAHRTPRKLLAETLNAIDPAKVIGIVFNGDDRPLSGYYKRYYSSYYRRAQQRPRGFWPWRRRDRQAHAPARWR
jgi:capsular exopolysaccharide synthesis family protein